MWDRCTKEEEDGSSLPSESLWHAGRHSSLLFFFFSCLAGLWAGNGSSGEGGSDCAPQDTGREDHSSHGLRYSPLAIRQHLLLTNQRSPGAVLSLSVSCWKAEFKSWWQHTPDLLSLTYETHCSFAFRRASQPWLLGGAGGGAKTTSLVGTHQGDPLHRHWTVLHKQSFPGIGRRDARLGEEGLFFPK